MWVLCTCCIGGVLAERSDIAKVAQLLLMRALAKVFMLFLLPSLLFGPGITPEQIVGALKILGFLTYKLLWRQYNHNFGSKIC